MQQVTILNKKKLTILNSENTLDLDKALESTEERCSYIPYINLEKRANLPGSGSLVVDGNPVTKHAVFCQIETRLMAQRYLEEENKYEKIYCNVGDFQKWFAEKKEEDDGWQKGTTTLFAINLNLESWSLGVFEIASTKSNPDLWKLFLKRELGALAGRGFLLKNGDLKDCFTKSKTSKKSYLSFWKVQDSLEPVTLHNNDKKEIQRVLIENEENIRKWIEKV